MNPINITDKKKQIELQPGIYYLKVLGGWKVATNNFSVILREIDGDLVIRSRKSFWKIQSYAFGKRAKKIASVDIPKWTSYEIEFVNPECLKVKWSNLFLFNFLQKYTPTEKIQICIG